MDRKPVDWIERRDVGMERAREKAERELGPTWTREAAEYLRVYAKEVAAGQPFLLEDAREASVAKLGQPTNLKAWGPAVIHAQRSGWIRRHGYRPARSSNGSPKCLWVAP